MNYFVLLYIYCNYINVIFFKFSKNVNDNNNNNNDDKK